MTHASQINLKLCMNVPFANTTLTVIVEEISYSPGYYSTFRDCPGCLGNVTSPVRLWGPFRGGRTGTLGVGTAKPSAPSPD